MLKLSVCFLYQCGDTALHIAAENRSTEIVKLLIYAGIDLNIQCQVSKLSVLTYNHIPQKTNLLHQMCMLN